MHWHQLVQISPSLPPGRWLLANTPRVLAHPLHCLGSAVWQGQAHAESQDRLVLYTLAMTVLSPDPVCRQLGRGVIHSCAPPMLH